MHVPLLQGRLDGLRAREPHLRHGFFGIQARLPQQAGGDGARAAEASFAVQKDPFPFTQGRNEFSVDL